MQTVVTYMARVMAPMGSDKKWIYLLWYGLLMTDMAISGDLECCRKIVRENWLSRQPEIISYKIYRGLPDEVIGDLGKVGTCRSERVRQITLSEDYENRKKGEKLCMKILLDQSGLRTLERIKKVEKAAQSPPKPTVQLPLVPNKRVKPTPQPQVGRRFANTWMEWLNYTVRSLGQSDCYVCTQGRPIGEIIPPPLEQIPWECYLALFQHPTAWGKTECQKLVKRFPVMKSSSFLETSSFQGPGKIRFPFCINRTITENLQPLGNLGQCETIICQNSSGICGNTSNMHFPRADIWWYCGGNILLPTLPARWAGICTVVMLKIPVLMASLHPLTNKSSHLTAAKRALAPSLDDRIYIDSIGVPRGVPDEYKARNQKAAGLESFLFWWVTSNKNVYWSSHIYSNLQRFLNYIREEIKGIPEQLDATSQMAWENRMALDMLLAEKEGLCVMMGEKGCCTYIPNNTAPEGTITRALKKFISPSEEFAENNSGVVTSFVIMLGVLIALGYCIIPYIRGLTPRLIETAITKEMPLGNPPAYQDGDTLCLKDEEENEQSSQALLQQFEQQ